MNIRISWGGGDYILMEFIKCPRCDRYMHPYLLTDEKTYYRCDCGETKEVSANSCKEKGDSNEQD